MSTPTDNLPRPTDESSAFPPADLYLSPPLDSEELKSEITAAAS